MSQIIGIVVLIGVLVFFLIDDMRTGVNKTMSQMRKRLLIYIGLVLLVLVLVAEIIALLATR